ncbi:MAG: hypothetical protein J6J79_06910 [Lachnospiraceae bacterium]|nr:hypothetical protein [Lachnospiraceae bacterium]
MKIRTMCGYADGVDIWVPSYDKNMLYKKSEEDECRLVCIPSGLDVFRNVRKICMYKNDLFFFSPYECKVGVFNVVDESLIQWNYYSKKYTQICEILFEDAICWIIPSDFEFPVLEVNLETKNVREFIFENDTRIFTRGMVVDGHIYIANRCGGQAIVSEIIPSTHFIQNHKIKQLERIECLYVDGDSVWVYGIDNINKAKIVQISVNSWEVLDEYTFTYSIYNNENALNYFRLFKYDNDFYLIPENGQPFRIFNWDNKCESIVEGTDSLEIQKNNYFETQLIENVMYIYVRNKNIIGILELDSKSYSEVCLFGKAGSVKDMKHTWYRNEGEYDTLSDFIEQI